MPATKIKPFAAKNDDLDEDEDEWAKEKEGGEKTENGETAEEGWGDEEETEEKTSPNEFNYDYNEDKNNDY